MKKNEKLFYGALGVAVVLFNVIAFAIPLEKTASFWVAYAFTMIAFFVQIIIGKIALGKAETMKSKFLGLPLLYIDFIYVTFQLIAFTVFFVGSAIPTWVSLVVCAMILGIASICLIAGESTRDEIQRVEEKVREKVSYIKTWQSEVEILKQKTDDSELKSMFEELIEIIKYSDPMSNDEVLPIEEKIQKNILDLKQASETNAKEIILEIQRLLIERNEKCKIVK